MPREQRTHGIGIRWRRDQLLPVRERLLECLGHRGLDCQPTQSERYFRYRAHCFDHQRVPPDGMGVGLLADHGHRRFSDDLS